MDILYDDKYLTVCVKPPDLLSEPDGTGHDIITELTKYLSSSGKAASLFPIHRLDFGTGGVMIFAKDAKTAASVSQAIAEKRVVKEYLAVIHGKLQNPSGVYKDLLFKDSGRNKSFVVQRKRAGVREASLEYSTLAETDCTGELLTLVRVKLHTGRTHQIRVQFSSRGTPLFGDRKYGGHGDGMALWSYKLEFVHPVDGRSLNFSKLPKSGIWKDFDLQSLIS